MSALDRSPDRAPRFIDRWALAAIVYALFAWPLASAVATYAEGIEAWSRVLTSYVDDQGRTDFKSLSRERSNLNVYVTVLATTGPRSRPELFDTPEKALAYHINAYNALAMHGVIEEDIPKNFSSFFKRAKFFKFRKVKLDGATSNLYDYENDVIRPLGDPRVHFALNCMVRDCPRLPREPFDGAKLDRQLQDLTVEFFSKPKYLRVDQSKREVRVSEILKFYTEDFVESGKRRDLVSYIDQYTEDPIPSDYRVRFIPYNWTINQSP